MKKKFFAAFLATVLVFALSVPAFAVDYGSIIDVAIMTDGDGLVLTGDSVEVTYMVSITNISKSGDLPQIVVKPLGDNTDALAASPITKIVNKETGVFEFTVVYTEVGTYEFWVNIKNMQGNSGKWNYEWTTDAVTVTIVAPPVNLPDGFEITDEGLVIDKSVLDAFLPNAQNTTMTITLDGNKLKDGPDFRTSKNDVLIKTFKTGTYVITNTNTANGESWSLTFEVVKVDGDNSIINIIE